MLDYQRVSLWHCGYRSLFAGFTNILGLSGWWHGLSGAGNISTLQGLIDWLAQIRGKT